MEKNTNMNMQGAILNHTLKKYNGGTKQTNM